MVSKKGYIKTLEAVIAVILIIVVSYTLLSRHVETPPEPPLIVQGAMRFINEKIELNDSIRYGIVRRETGIEDNIESIILDNKPRNYDFTCAVCSDSSTCFIATPLEKSVYVSDVFIASSEKKQNPKIIRIWFWAAPTKKEDLICYDTCWNQCQQK